MMKVIPKTCRAH